MIKVNDFNKLSLNELIKLPGVGRLVAGRIITARSKRKFADVKDLLKISGLGKTTLSRLGIALPEKKKKRGVRTVVVKKRSNVTMSVADFNTMSFEDMVSLPGVGNLVANRVILYRAKYKFNSVKDLLKIKGLGKTTLARLGIDIPVKVSKQKKIREIVSSVGFTLTRSIPFAEQPYNTRMAFYKDLVKDTCHRPDLVRQRAGCEPCPYALLCNCHLRNFSDDKGKSRPEPTKDILKRMVGNINSYYHFKTSTDKVDQGRFNFSEHLIK